MSDDLRRLVECDSEAPAELQRLLETAQRDVPTPDQLKQLAARLAPAIGAGVLVGASSGAVQPAAATLKSGAVLKVMLAGAVAAGVGLGVAAGLGEDDSMPALGHPARAARPMFEVPEPPPAPVAPAPSPRAAPEPETTPTPAPAARSAASPSEAQLLQQAQAMLKKDPARALALTRLHQRRFPDGVLAQEREVIAIEAMRRLGRAGDAKQRAEDFRRENPDSAHLPRIERTTPKP